MSLVSLTAAVGRLAYTYPMVHLALRGASARRQFVTVKNKDYVSYIESSGRAQPYKIESIVTFYNPFTATAKRLPKHPAVTVHDYKGHDRLGLELQFNSSLKARLIDDDAAMRHGISEREVLEEMKEVLMDELTSSLEKLTIHDLVIKKTEIKKRLGERVSKQLLKIGYEAEEITLPAHLISEVVAHDNGGDLHPIHEKCIAAWAKTQYEQGGDITCPYCERKTAPPLSLIREYLQENASIRKIALAAMIILGAGAFCLPYIGFSVESGLYKLRPAIELGVYGGAAVAALAHLNLLVDEPRTSLTSLTVSTGYVFSMTAYAACKLLFH